VASSGVQPAEVAQLMGNLRAGWAQPPTDTMADIKPHLQKVEVPVTPGLAVSLEVLLQNSLAILRIRAQTILCGSGSRSNVTNFSKDNEPLPGTFLLK
jgi:hypothetical protein